MTLKKTSLNEIHKKYGARMVEFAGWEMPVQYQGAAREHLAVRSGVGVFDVSHMGELEIVGRDAIPMAQKVTCNDVSRLCDGQAQYSAFLYPEGTILDDVVLYRRGAEHLLICVNAANRDRDFAWLKEHQEGAVEIFDNSDHYTQLAVQGPQAEKVLQELTDSDLSSLRYYWFQEERVCGVETLISRTGYTGEDGFEIYLPPQHAERVWEQLFEVGAPLGIVAAGLAARNTLRLEMKYALYGNDIDSTTTPLESGLSWIVKFSKADFIGRAALQRQKTAGVKRKLAGFEMVGRGIARDHYPVCIEGRRVSEVTSGSYCPSVKKAIGLTYLDTDQSKLGQTLDIEIRGKRVQARVVGTPFYHPS
ncbi:MAG: glycine cleavage system aminomethyltransferase GcvT [Acidobacteriota bacterium]